MYDRVWIVLFDCELPREGPPRHQGFNIGSGMWDCGCLDSSVGRAVVRKTEVRGFDSHSRIFSHFFMGLCRCWSLMLDAFCIQTFQLLPMKFDRTACTSHTAHATHAQQWQM